MNIKELVLTPQEAFDEALFMPVLYRKLALPRDGNLVIVPLKRSVDARGRKIVVRLQYDIVERASVAPRRTRGYPSVRGREPVVIIGTGPAGLFAALRLIELGCKPIVLERGKDVQARRYDLAAINKNHIVDPDSNYCFGEGGAGTYSDGKLYTRSKKRGDVQRIMEILVAHGAKDDILFDAHPHIGTNKLPKLVAALRESIKLAGGEVYFQTRVIDFVLAGNQLKGVRAENGEVFDGRAFILATGHSARDIFRLLNDKKVLIEAKPFALGVRVEHRQRLIDSIQYHCQGERSAYLPAAAYALVHQAKIDGRNKGVFTFCMCPGGFIVPAATAPGEVVVNGMSPSQRNARFANSGIVVAVDENDYQLQHRFGALAAMQFQAAIEQRAWSIAGKTQAAPAQRLNDFVAGRESSSLLETSYHPGLTAADMRAVLPEFIIDALRQGLKSFEQKMPGYLTNDAQIIGVESRTSSPVRIPRNKITLQHPQIVNLFPCGEGAGYAGGIVSAAMDGERCAEAAVRNLSTS
ncbi:MAG TPA: FAD-dependent oxidoreductase [Candidatus Binatia bacterium]|nr:FAD-dependent oxidoreductase [Candidatus Binatia bacterium]